MKKYFEPVRYEDLESIFGPAGNHAAMVSLPLPFPLRLSWQPHSVVNSFYGHPYIGEAFIAVLSQIRLAYGGTETLQKAGLDLYGGCFNDRQTRSGERKSVHAWGLAVDFVPHLGPYRSPPLTPALVVEAFEAAGFLWGGRWHANPDGMHFSSIVE